MFEKEEQRSDELETSLKLADSWKRQGDELLYSMIPRPVAERLRAGQNTLSTCQSFDEVSVLFAEVEVCKINSILQNYQKCFTRMFNILIHRIAVLMVELRCKMQ